MARIADGVDVAGADALLVIRQAFAGRMRLAQKVGNERVHAGGREEDRRVVIGKEGLALNLGVAFRLEEFDVFRAEFVRVHSRQ